MLRNLKMGFVLVVIRKICRWCLAQG